MEQWSNLDRAVNNVVHTEIEIRETLLQTATYCDSNTPADTPRWTSELQSWSCVDKLV